MDKQTQALHSSTRKGPWLGLALFWSGAWVAYQAWLLYQHVFSPLVPVLDRQGWWHHGNYVRLMVRPLLAFLLPALGLYVIFAWINARAFHRLLMPHLHRQRERLFAFLGQLLLTTFALSLLGAWVYPASMMGDALGLMLIPRGSQWLALGLGIVVSAYFLLWAGMELVRLPRIGQWAAGLLLTAPMALALTTTHRKHDADNARPDVILIGVDSLRPDHLTSFGAPFKAVPNIESFVQDSVVFSDALTTQAHTFPATASILTGLYPTNSGARGNLFPPSLVKTGHSIAWRFKAAGWRTVFGTDETRFSNIDELYGFEKVLGPGIGVPDYLMSFVSDSVLVNLTANTAAGRWLFPHLYGNRAVAHAYRPESFSRLLQLAVDGSDSRPLFLYVHLCSGHWPYEPPSLSREDGFDHMPAGQLADTAAGYLRAIGNADAQVSRLLTDLRERGRLENAAVVLFSDHGEDFGLKKDVILDDAGEVLSSGMNGHGSSAVREPQVRVLLAWQRFGQARFAPRETSLPVSLVDIAPTLADLAGLPEDSSVHYDGVSLEPALVGGTPEGMLDRIRFVESSKFVGALDTRTIEVGNVIAEEGSSFGFAPNGRVEVLPQHVAPQIALRERTAWSGRFVALLPRDLDAAPVLLDRQRLHWQPAASARELAAPLMAKLCEHWQADPITKARCVDWHDATTSLPPTSAALAKVSK
jgi:hypothetical protein